MKINIELIKKIFNNKIKIKKKEDKIKLSNYDEFIPMYDIYSEKIYPIKNTDLHFRLEGCHFRFITSEVYDWIKNKIKNKKNKNIITKLENNIEIIDNYDLDVLEKTSYNTLYKYSKKFNLQFSICKRNSFHPYLTYIKPYYSKIELIKLGKNNKIIKDNANIKIIDKKIHYEICKSISKNDVSREEIRNSNLNMIENNGLSLFAYYSFFGSYKFNNFLRNSNNKEYNISKIEYNNIIKINEIIKKSPKLKNDYYFYRFLANDDFLDNLKIGSTFTDPGFLSTTRDPFYDPKNINNFGLILLKIHIPKKSGLGIFVENFSLFKKEEEFLIPPFTELKLVSKNEKFKYFHINDEFQKNIKKKYEFKLIKTNYSKIQNIKYSQVDIPEIDIKEIELYGEDRIDLFKKFIYLTNELQEFSINVNDKKYIFNYEWFDSTSTYSKFFFNKTKDGIIFTNYKNGYPVLSIECGNEICINYIKRYYHSNNLEDLNHEEINMIASLFGKLFKYREVKVFPSYCNFMNIDSYKGKNKLDDDYDIIFSKLYCNTLYDYIKNNKKQESNIEYKYIFYH